MIEEKGVDELSQLYGETFKQIEDGGLVKGRIVGKTSKEMIVDVGYKSEGLISFSEFVNPAELNIGDEIEVFIEQKENEEGRIVLSRLKAERLKGWDSVVSTHKEGDIVEGKALRKVRGGLIVDIGVEAFLPNSLVGGRGPAGLNQLFGKPVKFKIIKIDNARKGIVLSRREAIFSEREEGKLLLVKGFNKGEDLKECLGGQESHGHGKQHPESKGE